MESNFNKRLRKKLSDNWPVRIYRVESHATSPGMPDDHYICGGGRSGWIEVKQEMFWPKRMPFRPKQPQWLVNYSKAGGDCWAFLHLSSTDTLVVVPGSWAEVADKSLAEAQGIVIELSDGDSAWRRLYRILATGFAPVGVLGDQRPLEG